MVGSLRAQASLYAERIKVPAVIGQAAVLFAVTNVDDILLLSLYFGQAAQDKGAERRIVIGQYLGFGAILAVSLLVAFGVGLLPEAAIAYLGLIPLALGLRAAISAWRSRHDDLEARAPAHERVTSMSIAGITLANGGDNIGVYVPVFAAAGAAGSAVYAVVFLVLVAVWCLAGRYFATRPIIARALARWGHILLPVVLIAIGLIILVEGGAFGL